MIKKLFIFIFATTSAINLFAQEKTADNAKPKKIEISSGIEGSILQFANFTNSGQKITTIPRYSYFFNTGFDADFKINKIVQPFSGLYIKNIGMIDKYGDSIKVKRRMYTIGAPVGLKFILSKNVKFKVGADANLVFNYKEKLFINGDKKSKWNEFFSNKTPLFYPSVFAGISFAGISLSANYYPQNFFDTNNYAYYSKMDAKLFTISAGINIDSKTLKNTRNKKK